MFNTELPIGSFFICACIGTGAFMWLFALLGKLALI